MEKSAEVTEVPSFENGYTCAVKTSDGVVFLRGVGMPQNAKVGTRGKVVYRSGSSYGLWFWEAA